MEQDPHPHQSASSQAGAVRLTSPSSAPDQLVTSWDTQPGPALPWASLPVTSPAPPWSVPPLRAPRPRLRPPSSLWKHRACTWSAQPAPNPSCFAGAQPGPGTRAQQGWEHCPPRDHKQGDGSAESCRKETYFTGSKPPFLKFLTMESSPSPGQSINPVQTDVPRDTSVGRAACGAAAGSASKAAPLSTQSPFPAAPHTQVRRQEAPSRARRPSWHAGKPGPGHRL